MSDEEFIDVKKADVPVGGALIVPIDDLEKIALFETDGEFYAIDNRCPHASASLGEGEFDGEIVECPLHGYEVNVKTGQCLTSAFRKAKRYKVEDAGGDTLRVSTTPFR